MIQYAIGDGPREYEVFDARTDKVIVTTRSLWLARSLAEIWNTDPQCEYGTRLRDRDTKCRCQRCESV